MNKIIITNLEANQRVDIALSKLTPLSRSMIQKIIIAKKLFCNNELILKANKKTQINEVYTYTTIESNLHSIKPEPFDLEIIFEDEELIIVNKPAELIVHPGAGHANNTLMNKITYHCTLSNINGPERLGTIHRLDKGVSGCIIFAKNNQAHINISQQFANREVKKQYIALCHNAPAKINNYVENYIARSKIHRKKMDTYENFGKPAQMHFVLKSVNEINQNTVSLIECHPITGRMHQIRLQLSKQKLPILNDPLYGIKESKQIQEIFQNRIALHAQSIEFKHPISNKTLKFEAPIPKEFSKIINY